MEPATEFRYQLKNDFKIENLNGSQTETNVSLLDFPNIGFLNSDSNSPNDDLQDNTPVILYIYPVDPNLYFYHKTNSVLERFVWCINGYQLYSPEFLYHQCIYYILDIYYFL